jgi:hypothetical protein
MDGVGKRRQFASTFAHRKQNIGANGSDRLCYAVFGASAVPVRSKIKGRPDARRRLPLALLDLEAQMTAGGVHANLAPRMADAP